MLKPCVDLKEFEKFGFRRCKGIPKSSNCYYLCVSRGVSMIFVSPATYQVNFWKDGDPRIHSKPNCRYRDWRTAIDITYDLIKAGMLTKVVG